MVECSSLKLTKIPERVPQATGTGCEGLNRPTPSAAPQLPLTTSWYFHRFSSAAALFGGHWRAHPRSMPAAGSEELAPVP